jgi:hypothetical protein
MFFIWNIIGLGLFSLLNKEAALNLPDGGKIYDVSFLPLL